MFAFKKIFLCLLLSVHFLYAQNFQSGYDVYKHYTVSFITPDQGLSQGSNYCRYEDSLGFLWITGNDAINRYDGNYIKVYNKDKYFERCKNLQQGYGFVEDNHQNIYIGSPDGLYVYNRKKDCFNLIFLLPEGKDQTVLPISFSDGKIWCHNKDFDILCFDIKSKTTDRYKTVCKYKVSSFHIYDNIKNAVFRRLPFADKRQNIWVVNPHGLFSFNVKSKISETFLENYLSVSKSEILCSSYDREKDAILIGTNKNLLIFDCQSGNVTSAINNSRIEGIAVGKNTIALKSHDFFTLYDKDFNLLHSEKLGELLASSYTYSFDKMNRLWICRDGFGQMIMDFNAPFLNRILSTDELFKTGVGSFAEFPDGDLLIQDDFTFNKKEILFTKIETPVKGAGFVKSITDKDQQVIWQLIQNRNEHIDLYRIDKTKKSTPYFKLPDVPDIGLLQDAICINGELLCSFQNGLYSISLKNKTIRKLEGQVKKNTFKINPISGNRILVSYLNQGASLYQLDAQNNITASKNILTGLQPFYFEEDQSEKKIWCGTNNGILVLNADFEIVKKIDANHNLAGTYIYGILLDGKGNCWASHQRGLSFINHNNYSIINFNKEDGIQDWDFNNRAYFKAADGTLFFGGMKGFNYFKPPLTYNNSAYQSKVYIDEILINQERLRSNVNNDYIQNIKLKPDQNNISIHAIVRNIYKGTQAQIVYRINHSKWIFKKSDCIIDLANLAPDTYVLELGVYDKFENKTTIQKKITVEIAFPIYKKIWFWVMILGYLFLILVWIIYRRRLNRQKRDFEQQLALEQQRKKITADLHDDIGATLSSLQLNSAVVNQIILKDTEKAKHLLHKIENQAKDLADKIGDIIWSMKPGKDEFMTMSSRIKNFVNDTLGATEIFYTIDINPEIDTLITDITTRKNIVLITKEVINNTAKYSKAKNVNISFQKQSNSLVLTISDDGIGFDPEKIKGNGITNIKKRTYEINGVLSILSSENKGSSITLEIPSP